MNDLTKYISSQFKNPKGFGGVLITIIQNIVNQELYKATSDIVSLAGGDRLLDIGYGNGHLLKKLYKKQQIEMYGIDISNDAKEMATKKNKDAAANGNLHLSIGDCCNLQYDANVFDVVTTINTVYFWSDTIKGLAEIYRVLKPGKSFYNVLFTKEYLDTIKYTQIGYKKFEPEELIVAGKQVGFHTVSIREISKGKSFIVIYTK